MEGVPYASIGYERYTKYPNLTCQHSQNLTCYTRKSSQSIPIPTSFACPGTSPNTSFLSLESVEPLQAILGLHPGQTEHTLRGLHSVIELQVDANYTRQAQPFCASFPQSLFVKNRAGWYCIDVENANADIVRGMADLMHDYDEQKSSLG